VGVGDRNRLVVGGVGDLPVTASGPSSHLFKRSRDVRNADSNGLGILLAECDRSPDRRGNCRHDGT
jgi:hypothetical protein